MRERAKLEGEVAQEMDLQKACVDVAHLKEAGVLGDGERKPWVGRGESWGVGDGVAHHTSLVVEDGST